MDTDTVSEWLYDHYALQRLKYRYCYCIDEKRVEEFVELFTDDAVVDFATREPYAGRAEIRRFIEEHVTESAYTAHLATNPLLTVDTDTATGKWDYLVFLSSEDECEMGQGVYHETYRRIDDAWKFTSIETERRFTHTI